MSAGRFLVLFLVALPAWADDRIDGARDPLGVLEEMAERITQTMAHNNVPLADAQEFILLVKEHGFK